MAEFNPGLRPEASSEMLGGPSQATVFLGPLKRGQRRQQGVMVLSLESEAPGPWALALTFEGQASDLYMPHQASTCLSFLLCQRGIVSAPTSEGAVWFG